MTAPGVRARNRFASQFACGAVICLAGAVYLNALNNPFVYDDYRLIVENQSLVDVSIRGLLLQDASRPVLNISFALDRAIWGQGPLGFHLTNVLLHMVNVALLYLLAVVLTDGPGAHDRSRAGTSIVARPHIVAMTAAVLLAVHPMMTQAVGYISGRSEVLCATFFLLALLSACRWMRGGSGFWLLLTGGAWALALGTKEIAVMFPLIVIACDRWVLKSDDVEQRRRLVRLHLPLLASAALLVTVRLAVFAILEHGGAVWPDWHLGIMQLDMVRRYLWMLALPQNQMIFHSIAPIESVISLRAVSGAITVAVLVALAWRLRRSHGLAGLGLIWFLALLVPSSVLFILGHGEPMAEHRVYLASCGLFLTCGVAFDQVEHRLREASAARVLFRLCALMMMALFAFRTFLRNEVWSDPVAVWNEAVTADPDHWLSYVPLGEELHRDGRHEDAVIAFATAARLRPQELSTYRRLGVCLIETGKLDAARATFQQLGALEPESSESAFGLGLVALAEGNKDAARELLRTAVQRDPSSLPARRVLADLESGKTNGSQER